MLKAVLLVGVLAACMAAAAQNDEVPRACKCHPKDEERLRKHLGPLAGMEHICDTVTGAGCSIDVPVVKLPNGSCTGYLRYCVLCVVGRGPHRPVWSLTEYGQPSRNFQFDAFKGIDIHGAKGGGKTHFDNPRRDTGDTTKFSWVSGRDKNERLNHDSVIEAVRHKDRRCERYDPIIVNTD